MTETIPTTLLDYNKGQLDGLPKNPRFFRDYRYEKSITESPEMLGLRELIVYPLGDRYVVVCGNLRLRACKELDYSVLRMKLLDRYPSLAYKAPSRVRVEFNAQPL